MTTPFLKIIMQSVCESPDHNKSRSGQQGQYPDQAGLGVEENPTEILWRSLAGTGRYYFRSDSGCSSQNENPQPVCRRYASRL